MKDPNYYKEFAKSQAHALIGVGVLAAAATASPLVMMVAAAAYAVTWIYFPTSHLFVKRVLDRLKLAEELAKEDQLGEFIQKRDSLISRLSVANYKRYNALSETCAEVAGNESANMLINGKLQELLWTYLKMLLMQQGIETYLAETDAAAIDKNLAAVEREIQAMGAEQTRLKTSKESLRNTLTQHKKSLGDAQENLLVLNSELSRLEHEIQLLRVDAIANRNSDVLSAKINASVESLQEGKTILRTMSNVDDMAFDLPSQAYSLGFHVAQDEEAQEEPAPRKRRARN